MTEKNMWNLSPQEALKACQASEQGLTTEQAEKIRLEKGENVLLEEKKKSAFQVFLWINNNGRFHPFLPSV